jgi:hypothetical protein
MPSAILNNEWDLPRLKASIGFEVRVAAPSKSRAAVELTVRSSLQEDSRASGSQDQDTGNVARLRSALGREVQTRADPHHALQNSLMSSSIHTCSQKKIPSSLLSARNMSMRPRCETHTSFVGLTLSAGCDISTIEHRKLPN